MHVAVALEHRFTRTPDGAVWTGSFFARSFWERYLAVFDGVRIISRVRDASEPEAGWKRVDGEGVSVVPIPHYVGTTEYLRRRAEVIQACRNAVRPEDAVILRVSSQIANCMERQLRRTRHPFAVEVVADPYLVFSPGAVNTPLRSLLRWWFPMRLRRQCRDACAASYVTRDTLQRSYPPGRNAFHTNYSSVELGRECFVAAPRIQSDRQILNLIFVGSLEVFYKAPDVLLNAVAACRQDGLDIRLTLLGDGRRRPELARQAESLGIAPHVHFTGLLPSGEAVREHLDRADLFVLPSLQEGLPRAMIEAMARALPCIGSTAGGIPELLPTEDMVPPGDTAALASKIREIAIDPQRLHTMSRRSLETAADYAEDVLSARRVRFYRALRESTKEWLAGDSACGHSRLTTA